MKTLKSFRKMNKALIWFFRKKNLERPRIENDHRSKESIFTEIYRKNLWGGKSRSGGGSDLDHTENVREGLPNLLKELKIQSLLDIPCGDLLWLKEIDLDFLSYTGADMVEDIIIHNNKKYSNKKRKFIKLDICQDTLPTVDLILCRDLFQHFSFADIWKSLENIKKSNPKYLLATSITSIKSHVDCVGGRRGREVNLLAPPFSFPKPLKIINDTYFKAPTKKLLLWKTTDIPS